MTVFDRPRLTFVLGGGGGPGLAYLCGALRALEEIAGLRVADADLTIGTSAGSVVAARLLHGHSYHDILQPAEPSSAGYRNTVLVPRWNSRVDLARCSIGASWAVSRSLLRVPVPRQVLCSVNRVFPPALFAVQDWSAAHLPDEWPDRPLWLVTSDVRSNRRVVLHRAEREGQHATLVEAVAASCAVPGVFMPSTVGRHQLVDGGVHSSTNIDLAARVRSEFVIALAPMAYDPSMPIAPRRAAARSAFTLQLLRERSIVKRSGGTLLLLRPSGADLAARRGGHLFDQSHTEEIEERSYSTTISQLDRDGARAILMAARESLVNQPA